MLGVMLVATTAYQVRVAKYREPYWFQPNPVWKPFFLGDDGVIGFLNPAAKAAGLTDDDRLLAVNGRPLKGRAVYGEQLMRSRLGDVMNVTVLHRDSNGRHVQKIMNISMVREPRSSWNAEILNALLAIVLPYLVALLGFWVAAVRPRDPLAWLVLIIMLGYEFFWDASAEQWLPVVRDAAIGFRAAINASIPIWLLLFGIYFPEPFPKSSRFAKWTRYKWILIVPLGLGALAQAVSAIAGMENQAKAVSFWRWPLWVRVLEICLFYATIGFSLQFILIKMRSAPSVDARRRLRLLTLGSLIGLGPFFLLRAVSLIMDVNPETYFPQWLWLGSYVLYYLFPLVLAWVIVVHRAMDVRVVLRQGVQYALAQNSVRVIQIVATVVVFIAAVTLVAGSGGNRVENLVIIGIGLAALLTVQRGSGRLRVWIDRRFFREAYNAEQMLSELSDQVRTMVQPARLIETVAKRISETLHIGRIAVLLDSGSPFRPAYALGCGAVSDLAFAPQSATVQALLSEKQPVHVYLEDDNSWVQRQAEEAERAQLSRLQPELLLPLIAREKLLGFVSLGAKRSEEPYTNSDLKLLNSVATQTGLALENAQLVAAITEEVAQRERMNREVEIAREVQERLFPQQLPQIAGLDFTGACRPALGVGGDYYDFLELPDGQLGIALGDVSGKGIGAALLMASLQASLRAEATRARSDLAALVGNVNRLVYQSSTSNRYATFFYAQYDPRRLMLTYVNAGHNPPMLFRKNGLPPEVIRLEAGGTVVGLMESFPYQQETLQLAHGDVLLAFTDGISEAMNPDDEEWGETRLVETVEKNLEISANDLLSRIMANADAFTAGAKQHDDMTLVVLRVG